MKRQLIHRYGNIVLPDLAVLISEDYYPGIEQSLANMADLLDSLPGDNEHRTYYSNLFNELNVAIAQFLDFRKALIPYLGDLQTKVATHHNCAECSGNCDAQHTIKISEFIVTQKLVGNLAAKIREALPPDDADTTDDQLKILINEVINWDSMMQDILYLEEQLLLPRIIEAQTQINVRS